MSQHVKTLSNWEIYQKLLALEETVRQIRLLFSATILAKKKICHHPVNLEGIWAGIEITDETIEAAKHSMFPYQYKIGSINHALCRRYTFLSLVLYR